MVQNNLSHQKQGGEYVPEWQSIKAHMGTSPTKISIGIEGSMWSGISRIPVGIRGSGQIGKVTSFKLRGLKVRILSSVQFMLMVELAYTADLNSVFSGAGRRYDRILDIPVMLTPVLVILTPLF